MTEEIIQPEYGDLYLKFADEASANEALKQAGLVSVGYTAVPVLVESSDLEATLDQGELGADHIVTHDSKLYWANAGKWYELVERPVLQPTGLAAIDVIGSIEGAAGWHVNTRGHITEALQAFATTPSTPLRVWA